MCVCVCARARARARAQPPTAPPYPRPAGRCERDATKCTSSLYTKYAKALRKDYSAERPAQPVLYLDGTGGTLGKGICHGTMGCADFISVGGAHAKQSVRTLQPFFLYQGSDHTEPLRANTAMAMASYNSLVAAG